MLLVIAILVAAILITLARIASLAAKTRREEARLRYSARRGRVARPIIGLFHPYCHAGGGGERVLWTIVRALQQEVPAAAILVYSGDVFASKEDMLAKAKTQFNITVSGHSLEIVHLRKRSWVEDTRYPRFTLLGQSLGSLLLGWEALSIVPPDIFFDTMGYAFTYPLAKLHGCLVAAYYHLFAAMYGFVGSFADEVMVNSTWTKGHIDRIWRKNAAIVYPPCGTAAFHDLPFDGRGRVIVSVAQFRPEKDHALQLRALEECFKSRPEWRSAGPQQVTLQLIGSVRCEKDRARVEHLRELCLQMGLQGNVEFVVDASFEDLRLRLSRALVGIHSMWNEHFGIGVVEYMAAGAIPLVHDSGGPKMDIVVDDLEKVGYLAATSDGYAKALVEIFELTPERCRSIQEAARRRALHMFSEQSFVDGCIGHVNRLLQSVQAEGVALE